MEIGLDLNNLGDLTENSELMAGLMYDSVKKLPNGYLLVKQGNKYIVKDNDKTLFSTSYKLTLEGQFLVEDMDYGYSIRSIDNPSKCKPTRRYSIQDNLAIILNGYSSLVDSSMKYVLPPIYHALKFSGTKLTNLVISASKGDWFNIEIDKETLEPKYFISEKVRGTLYKKGVQFKVKDAFDTDLQYSLFDINTKLSEPYDDIIDIYKALDYLVVLKNFYKGIIDITGREVIAPIYKDIYHVCDEVFIIKYSNTSYNVFIDGKGQVCNRNLSGMTRTELGIYYLYLLKDNGDKEWFVVGNKGIYRDVLKAFPLTRVDGEEELYNINIYGSNKLIDRNFNEKKKKSKNN